LDSISAEVYLKEIEEELARNILPFWTKTIDQEKGGFVGRIRNDGTIIEDAPKSAVLNTRILWTYSAVFRYFREEKYRELARRAYRYIRRHFRDRKKGGIFWMVDAYGIPIDEKKQIYAQAFGIYALSEYYRITEDREAVEWAGQIFTLIEEKSYDAEFPGYFEAFDRGWDLLADVRLSAKDRNERKTMNTHLHLLEAYTNLSKVWESRKLRRRLEGLVEIFLDRIIDEGTGHFHLFFDDRWNVRSDAFSFGHDIEGSWLLFEAGKVLGNKKLSARIDRASLRLAEATLREGVDTDGGVMHEGDGHRVVDTDKHWWPQAEAMVGFLNAFQMTKDRKFYEASLNCWKFTQERIIDRDNGEWFFRVDKQGQAYLSEEDKVGPWKGPYHNARACLEIMRRLKQSSVNSPLS